jgi:hypothetical protein
MQQQLDENMVCSGPAEVAVVMPTSEVVDEKRDDFVEGIIEGLKDFAEGRYTVFKDDDELEAHLMSL